MTPGHPSRLPADVFLKGTTESAISSQPLDLALSRAGLEDLTHLCQVGGKHVHIAKQRIKEGRDLPKICTCSFVPADINLEIIIII